MFGCRKKMSAIAILDYSGAEAVYHHMESLAEEGRQTWIAHHGSGSASMASRPSSQPQSSAQVQMRPCMHLAVNRGHVQDHGIQGKGMGVLKGQTPLFAYMVKSTIYLTHHREGNQTHSYCAFDRQDWWIISLVRHIVQSKTGAS